MTSQRFSSNDSTNMTCKRGEVDFHKVLLWKYTWIPYAVGLLWFCLHPMVSVMTGELKCRGAFVDERGLLNNYFSPSSYDLSEYENILSSSPRNHSEDFCRYISGLLHIGGNSPCHSIGEHLGVLQIRPSPVSALVTQPDEAVAIIVSSTLSSQPSILALIDKLASDAPWLAKSVFIVSGPPDKNLTKLSHDFFVAMYSSTSTPPELLSTIIRQVIVVDVLEHDSRKPLEISIVPQGRRGTTPNLDLAFLAVDVFYDKAKKINMYPSTASSSIISYSCQKMKDIIEQHSFGGKNGLASVYINEMCNMLLFMQELAVESDSSKPHTIFLEHGVDSLTIEAFDDQLLAPSLEQMIRSMSNLDEVLHHSVSQYWMPSMKKFVSNAEYIFPPIIMLIPLVIRIFSMIFYANDRVFILASMKILLSCIVANVILNGFKQILKQSYVVILYFLIYAITICHSTSIMRKFEVPRQKELIESIEFIACSIVVLIHVPLVLSNTVLALPPIMLWSPLFSSIKVRQQASIFRTVVYFIVFTFSWLPTSYCFMRNFSLDLRLGLFHTFSDTALHLIWTQVWILSELHMRA